jgi:hypothetical protein
MLTAGEITPEVMRKWETACLGYFESKEVAEGKQVRKVFTGLKDDHIQEWLSVNRKRFLELLFDEFLVEFKSAYLPEDWKETTHIELLRMTQGSEHFGILLSQYNPRMHSIVILTLTSTKTNSVTISNLEFLPNWLTTVVSKNPIKSQVSKSGLQR